MSFKPGLNIGQSTGVVPLGRAQENKRSRRAMLVRDKSNTASTFKRPCRTGIQAQGRWECEPQAEIVQLRELLSEALSQQRPHSDDSTAALPATDPATSARVSSQNGNFNEIDNPIASSSVYLSDPRGRSPPGYYHQHTLLRFFYEVRQQTRTWMIIYTSLAYLKF
jgi:hypothetical protein